MLAASQLSKDRQAAEGLFRDVQISILHQSMRSANQALRFALSPTQDNQIP